MFLIAASFNKISQLAHFHRFTAKHALLLSLYIQVIILYFTLFLPHLLRSSTVVRSKFFCIGRTKSLPLAMTVFSILTDCVSFPSTSTRSFELLKHLSISKPPQWFSLGKVWTMILRKSSMEQELTVMECSPSPAPSNKIFEEGALHWPVSPRQNTFNVHGWARSFFLSFGSYCR